jgi:hypothetical protein
MSGLDNLREVFQGRRGVVLLAGGAVFAGYLYWTRGRTGTPALSAVPGDRPGTRAPSSPSSPDSEPGTRRPENNAEWLALAVDVLMGRGTPGGIAFTALSKALAGQPLTAQEQALVSQAIQALGTPPGGMPPLNSTPPDPPPDSPDSPDSPRDTPIPRRPAPPPRRTVPRR